MGRPKSEKKKKAEYMRKYNARKKAEAKNNAILEIKEYIPAVDKKSLEYLQGYYDGVNESNRNCDY